jgi:hypothetical protein
VQLDDAEIGRPVAGGVQTFLRAYRPAAARGVNRRVR